MARRTRGGGARRRGAAGKAELLLHEKVVLPDESIMEIVLWSLPQPTPERPHGLKYRLYYGRHGVCLVRYDNETGKGDPRHFRGREMPYDFKSVEQLRRNFEKDMRAAGGKHEKDA
jgi:hypothetical protein